MRSGAIFFLAGIMLLQQFATLPSYYWCLPVVPLFIFLLWRRKFIFWLLFSFAFGFSWALFISQHRLQQSLAPDIVSKDVVIEGRIVGIPKQYSRYTRFEFIVERMMLDNQLRSSPSRIQLNWYGKQLPVLIPGDYWQLQVRLKPPVGTFNPGGFDYEKYLFQKGIQAKGYVRKSELNQILLSKQDYFNLDRIRYQILRKLEHQLESNNNAALVYALAIGERSSMSPEHWDILRDSGTAHLMAISGLHIGLVAAIGFCLGRWLWSFCGRAPLVISAYKIGALSAISIAFIYALLAGWSIPTQRAFIMVTVVMGGLMIYRNQNTSQVLALALFTVLFYDPLAVLSSGFWLSFAAVSVIAFTVTGIKSSTCKIKRWGYVQWAISMGLLPLMLLLFQQVSIISPIANLWAIPVVTIIAVPLILLALPNLFLFDALAGSLLQVVITVIDGTWWLLELMVKWPWSVWHAPIPELWVVFLALVGVVIFLSPKGFPVKNLSLIFLLPLFFPVTDKLQNGEVKFTLLDVGQGLSAVIQTKEHVLLFDTGPRLSQRFDAGDRIVLPFLRQEGIDSVDALFISHEDNDLIGGASSIVRQIPVRNVFTSKPEEFTQHPNVTDCSSGQSWQWDKVRFEVLHPARTFINKREKRRQRNNRSCVLRIESGEKSILLSADIEKQAEHFLVEKYGGNLNSDVLVVPHHGSHTSSSARFLEVVNPRLALLPVGYLNRYRLPGRHVLKRYQAMNIPLFSTALEGAISFKLLKNHPIKLAGYRRQSQRYWHNVRD